MNQPKAKTPAQLFEENLYRAVCYKTFPVTLWAGQNSVTSVQNYRYYFPTDSGLDRSIITSIEVHAGDQPNSPGDYAPGISYGGPGYNIEYIVESELSCFCLTLVDHQNNHVWENQVVYSLYKGLTGRYKKRLYNRLKFDKCFVTAYTPFSILAPPPAYERQLVFTVGYIPPKS